MALNLKTERLNVFAVDLVVKLPVLKKNSAHKWYSILTMIYIGSDHGGYGLKEKLGGRLEEWGYDFVDWSPKREEKDDYPDAAIAVAEKVVEKKGRGILI